MFPPGLGFVKTPGLEPTGRLRLVTVTSREACRIGWAKTLVRFSSECWPFSATAAKVYPHRSQQTLNTDDVHDPREIVSEYVQRHFGSYLWQALQQKMGRAHPHLQSGEGMLSRLAPHAHRLLK